MYGTCRALCHVGGVSEIDADFVVAVVALTVRILIREVRGTKSSWRSSPAAYYAVYQPLGPFLCRYKDVQTVLCNIYVLFLCVRMQTIAYWAIS